MKVTPDDIKYIAIWLRSNHSFEKELAISNSWTDDHLKTIAEMLDNRFDFAKYPVPLYGSQVNKVYELMQKQTLVHWRPCLSVWSKCTSYRGESPYMGSRSINCPACYYLYQYWPMSREFKYLLFSFINKIFKTKLQA